MHGPTFMGNPLAAAVALASIRLLLSRPWRDEVSGIERHLRQGLAPVAELPGVADVRVLGAIGVVEMVDPLPMADAQQVLLDHGVWLRPFGRLLYTMPPYVSTADDVTAITGGHERRRRCISGLRPLTPLVELLARRPSAGRLVNSAAAHPSVAVFVSSRASRSRIVVLARVGRGEQLVAEEHAAGPGVQAQGLELVAHVRPPRRQPHHRARHHQPGGRDRAHQLQGVEPVGPVQWRARDLHQQVDRHALGVGIEAGELGQQTGAVAAGLTHADDAAAAQLHRRVSAGGPASPVGPGRSGW